LTTATVTATSDANPNVSASATVTLEPPGEVNPQAYGATGNGTTNDTAAINKAIAALIPGDTLLFPCGTYLTTSQLFINATGVTVNGSSCATIHNTSSGTVMVIGGTGTGVPSYGTAVALSSTADELATSFTTVSSLGVSAGSYVLLQEGGEDYSTDTLPGHPTKCDVSGCRGEVVEVQSVSGNTVTVTTALHDTYVPGSSGNAATAQVINTPLTGMTIENITMDGNNTNEYGLEIAGVANSTVAGVTVQNVQGSAILSTGNFGVSWSNITVTGAGSEDCGAATDFGAQGNLQISGLSISSENPGTSGNNCIGDGAFGFALVQSANSTITNVTVNASGADGRPFKTTSARWNTFTLLVVENDAADFSGISLEYYSSHNTYNNCTVTNNGAGTGTGNGSAGINTFGNFNQYNTFNNCTAVGNGNVQFLINNYDALQLGMDTGDTINGGTYTGTATSEPVIDVFGADTYITSAQINGPGIAGIYLGSTGACVNNNTFGANTNLTAGINSASSTNIGSGNTLNGNSSNLTSGTCSGP
jgi:hypothetical protein